MTEQRSGWKKMTMYVLVACFVLPLAGVLTVAVLQTFITDSKQVLKLHDVASWLHAVGLTVQCVAVALVIVRWRSLVSWMAVKGIVQPFELERALAFRGKVAAFLLLYLILIPIGPYRIWSLFAGSAG